MTQTYNPTIVETSHLNGVPWDEIPAPPTSHRCWVQTVNTLSDGGRQIICPCAHIVTVHQGRRHRSHIHRRRPLRPPVRKAS